MNWLYRLSRFVCRTGCQIWFRCKAHGLENVPADGPLLLASNHSSHLDPVVMGIFLPRRCFYVARVSLGKIPLVGWWMKAIGVIFIDRKSPGREAIGRAVEALEQGKVVGMFPEGTRSADGRIQEFQRGLLLLLKKSRANIVPVGIEGSFSALPKGAFLPRPRRITVRYGTVRTADEVLAPGGLDVLRQDVAALSNSELAAD